MEKNVGFAWNPKSGDFGFVIINENGKVEISSNCSVAVFASEGGEYPISVN